MNAFQGVIPEKQIVEFIEKCLGSKINEDYTNANNSLNKAILLDPNYVLAYENLALSARIQNNMDDLKLYLNKILEIAPNHKAKQILKDL